MYVCIYIYNYIYTIIYICIYIYMCVCARACVCIVYLTCVLLLLLRSILMGPATDHHQQLPGMISHGDEFGRVWLWWRYEHGPTKWGALQVGWSGRKWLTIGDTLLWFKSPVYQLTHFFGESNPHAFSTQFHLLWVNHGDLANFSWCFSLKAHLRRSSHSSVITHFCHVAPSP